MKVLVLVLSMFVSEMSISAPMTFSVKTEQLGMMRPASGGPRAMVARIRAKMQARRAARQAAKAQQAAVAAPQAAAGQ